MPYIGRELDRGNYLKLDDISSSFNNSLTTFNLTNGGKAFYPGSAFSILVVLAGVVQEPETAYQINQAQITFASAPLAGDQFFCIALGVALGVNTPANGSVNGTQLAKPFNYDGYFYLDDTNNRVGIATATPQKPLHVVGEGQFDSVRVLGDLTVDGTTTTLDTAVTEVDRLEVGANNNTVAVAVTQSGSGDAAYFMGGDIGIGTNAPTAESGFSKVLHVHDDSPQVLLERETGSNDVKAGFNVWSGNASFETFTATPLRIRTSGNTNQLYLNTNGNIGINDATPVTKLVIRDTLQASAANHYSFIVKGDDNGTNGESAYIFLSAIDAFTRGVAIGAELQSTSNNHDLVFKTSNISATPTEKVRITNTGNVGIGSATPQSMFEVYGSSPIIRSKHSTSQKYTQINHNGTDGYLDWSSGGLILRGASNTERLHITSAGTLDFKTTDGVGINFRESGYINIDSDNDDSNRNFTFYDAKGTGSESILMRILDTGNIGIGENNPQNSLHISGSAPAIRFADTGANGSAFSIIEDNNGLLKIRNDAGNSGTGSGIAFEVDAGERLRIDSDGRLLAGGAVAANAWAGGDDLIIGNATSGTRSGITLVSGSNTDGGLYWSDGNSGTALYQGQLVYNHGNSKMQFYTAGSARVTIDGSGRLLIGRTDVLASSAERLTVDSGMAMFRNSSNNAAAVYIRNEDTTASTRQPYLMFTDGGGNRGGFGVQYDEASLWIAGQGGIAFRTNGSAPSQTERLRITSSGVKQVLNGNLNIYQTYIDFSGDQSSTPQTAAAIYRPADNTLAFSTANTERFRIRSDGRIAIGTQTINTDSMLSIHRSSSDQSQIRFTNTTTGEGGNNGLIVGIDNNEHGRIFNLENHPIRFGTNNTERFRIDEYGNIRIMTTNGQLKWLASSGNDPFIRSIGSGQQELEFNTGGAERLRIDVNGIHKISTAGNTQDGTFYSTLTINNTAANTFSRIRFDRSGVARFGLTLRNDDKLCISNLYEGGSVSANDAAFVMDGNSNIGINKAAPSSKLHINNGGNGNSAIEIDGDYLTVSPSLNLDFAKSRKLDDRIYFHRDSIGTYFDANGLLKVAGPHEPRFDHDPRTGQSLGLMIEESRTNLVNSSENPSDWNVVHTAANETTYKIKGIPTVKLIDGSGDGDSPYLGGGTYGNGKVTMSMYIDAVNSTSATVRMYLFGNGYGTIAWSLSGNVAATAGGFSYNGSNHSNGSAQTIDCGGGIYRLVMTFDYNGGNTTSRFYVTPSGADSDYIYIAGMQLEQGGFATSYIPTSGTPVTRSQDRAEIKYDDWYNDESYKKPSTFAGRFRTYDLSATRMVAEGSDGSNLKDFSMNTVANSAQLQFAHRYTANNSYGNTSNAGVAINTDVNFAFSYDGTDGSLLGSANRSTPFTGADDLGTTSQAGGDRMRIGSRGNNSIFLNGTIAQLRYFPVKATSAQLLAQQ